MFVTELWNPDLPSMFVHFTGRKRGLNDPVPEGLPLSPEARLTQILEQGKLLASERFTYRPAVCVSESSPDAVKAFFSTGVTVRGAYDPWALLLNRDACIQAGFLPVIHATELEITAIKAQAEEDARVDKLLGRMIWFKPPDRDWLHEREWRRSFMSATPRERLNVSLDGLVHAVITSEPNWTPPLDRAYSPACRRLERVWWNGTDLKEDGWLDLPT